MKGRFEKGIFYVTKGVENVIIKVLELETKIINSQVIQKSLIFFLMKST